VKSKFAKITDGTLGAFLLFFAAYAVMRYYLPNSLAVFSAAATAMTALLLFGLSGKRKDEDRRLSAAADGMFYDFMFLPANAPITLLAKGLRARGETPTVHGSGLYLGGTAAFAVFDKPLDQAACARLVARARHYGAARIVALVKSPPAATVDVKDVKLRAVVGDDTYKLFASLSALPPHKFERAARPRFYAFRNALGKDKTPRYLILSASLFFVSRMTSSVVAVVCAAIAAALFAASVIYNIAKAAKQKNAA
jgi:hypothetical protein